MTRAAVLFILFFFGALEPEPQLALAQFQLVPDTKPVVPRIPKQRQPKPEMEAQLTKGNFPRRLKQADMQARFFIGAPIKARALGGGLFEVTFHKDGLAERLDVKKNITNQGKWRFLGDAYCSRWAGEPEICYTLVQDGEIVKVVRGTRAVSVWYEAGSMQAVAPMKPAEEPSIVHKRDRVRAPQKQKAPPPPGAIENDLAAPPFGQPQ